MRSLLHASDRAAVIDRLAELRAHDAARWGAMDARAMLAHLAQSLRLAMGEVPMPATPRPGLAGTRVVRWLAIWSPLRLPRGVKMPREAFPAPTAIDDDRAAVTRLMARFADPAAQRWASHPLFGALGARGWGRLGWKHFDHHLRQFGR